MKQIKLIVFLVISGLVGFLFFNSGQISSEAKGDSVLEEIAKYKSWGKVHKEDEKIANGAFRITDSSVAGWSIVSLIPSLEIIPSRQEPSNKSDENEEQDPVLQTLTKPGTRLIMPSEETQIRNGESASFVFDTFRSTGRTRKSSPHEIGFETFGRVFANELAKNAVEKNKTSFPEGSIFVREKFLKENDSAPETITAMVKREKGFSRKTDDWEFFTFNGADLKLKKRETKSECAKCHSQTKETDFVFKTYLK